VEQPTLDLPLREWRLDESYRLHLVSPPAPSGLRHAACGKRLRCLDIGPGEIVPDHFTRCRDCRNAAAIERQYNLVVNV
jgi:hypothetical protein